MSTVSVDARSRSPRVAKVNASSAVSRGGTSPSREAWARTSAAARRWPRGAGPRRGPTSVARAGRKSACVAQSVTKQHLAHQRLRHFRADEAPADFAVGALQALHEHDG